MNGNELTESEKKIIEEGNAEQIALMRANRTTIEGEAIASGRYPMWLAVELMTDNLKARWALRDRLDCDARYGRLPMYRKGDVLPAEYILSPLALKESDEYFWDDLNRWLKENAPQIKWRFPAPEAENAAEQPVEVIPNSIATIGANEKLPPYLTTSDLVGCFGAYMGVKKPAKVLSEYPVWARKNGALVRRGKRGKPTKENPDVSAWNPVMFAQNLLDKKPLPQLDELGELKQQHLDTVFSMKPLAKWKPIWGKSKPL